jgi:dihydroorotase
MYDLLIKGGKLVDPSQGLEDRRDVAILGNRIIELGEDLVGEAKKVVDASGKIVTPGLIDLHTHLYWGVTNLGVEPDSSCLANGVTTVLEAGSAGCMNFPGLRRHVIERSRTRIIPLLHISSVGLATPEGIGELQDLRNLDYEGAVETGLANKDLIRGIKIRLATPPASIVGEHGRQALRLALEAAEDIGGFLMVHPKGIYPEIHLSKIVSILRKGDVVTHTLSPTYDGFPNIGILDEETGKVFPEVLAAKEKGVIFDVGHGTGSFSFEIAKRALEQGFLPSTISTDLHTASLKGEAKSMPHTMSKFLALGLPLSRVVEMSTAAPARALGMAENLGTLRPGAVADVVVFDLTEGKYIFHDVRGLSLEGRNYLRPSVVVKDGIVTHNGE